MTTPPHTPPTAPNPDDSNAKKETETIKPLHNLHRWGTLLEALLKHPLSLADHISTQHGHRRIVLSALGLTCVCLLLYGLVIGTFALGTQLWATPLKLLCGTLLSALICLPSLYIFTCLTGTQARAEQLFTGFLAALALVGILLVGFAPIIWVFSQSTDSLGFMGVLIVASWVISLGFAHGFLKKLLRRAGARSLQSLTLWSAIFLLVTLQMSTTLRPLIGQSPELLAQEKRFFITHWVETAGTFLTL